MRILGKHAKTKSRANGHSELTATFFDFRTSSSTMATTTDTTDLERALTDFDYGQAKL